MKNILLYDNLHRTKLRVNLWKQTNPGIEVYKEIQATADTLDAQSHISADDTDIQILLFTESENYFNLMSELIHRVRVGVKVVWIRWG